MREILFRGKLKDNGEWMGKWINGDLLQGGYDYEIAIWEKETKFVTEVIPETVGQYIGLTDKNGAKIFEGDIIKAEINGGPYDRFVFPVGVIAFENCSFGNKDRKQFTPLSSYAPRVSFEVIGNIHDNPELLKGGSE